MSSSLLLPGLLLLSHHYSAPSSLTWTPQVPPSLVIHIHSALSSEFSILELEESFYNANFTLSCTLAESVEWLSLALRT